MILHNVDNVLHLQMGLYRPVLKKIKTATLFVPKNLFELLKTENKKMFLHKTVSICIFLLYCLLLVEILGFYNRIDVLSSFNSVYFLNF